MPKKILIDARMYGLEHAGIGRYLINLIKELKNLKTKEQFTILLRKKYFYQLKFPRNWRKISADFRHYTFKEQIKLPAIIRREKPHLVHFPHLNVPIFWGGNYILTVHDLTMHHQSTNATSLPLPLYYLKRIPFLLISFLAVKNAHKIIVPSNFVKNDVVNYYSINPNKVKVIYEGTTSFSKISNTKYAISNLMKKYQISRPYFIYVGNAYPHKNLEIVIKAAKLLNKKFDKKVQILIGGSKDIFKNRLGEKIKKQKADEYIKLIGYIPDKDLDILIRESISFIYPSLSEGFGLQGLEAMSAGTLVLASSIPVFKEIYGKHALFFNPNNPLSLVKMMRKALIFKKTTRLKRIKDSKEFINKYSWQKMTETTLEIYNQFLNV